MNWSRWVIGYALGRRTDAQADRGGTRARHRLVFHSDPGSQYASETHRLLLAAHDFASSMSRRGNPYDNRWPRASSRRSRSRRSTSPTTRRSRTSPPTCCASSRRSTSPDACTRYLSPNKFEDLSARLLDKNRRLNPSKERGALQRSRTESGIMIKYVGGRGGTGCAPDIRNSFLARSLRSFVCIGRSHRRK
jgi:hypothetical protein